jgi:hypothetical protein
MNTVQTYKFVNRKCDLVSSIIHLAKSAKNLFQFISDGLNPNELNANSTIQIKINMDASSTAY